MANAKKMKAAIDAHRAAAGEPPRPKDMALVPGLKKPPKRDIAAELAEAVGEGRPGAGEAVGGDRGGVGGDHRGL